MKWYTVLKRLSCIYHVRVQFYRTFQLSQVQKYIMDVSMLMIIKITSLQLNEELRLRYLPVAQQKFITHNTRYNKQKIKVENVDVF